MMKQFLWSSASPVVKTLTPFGRKASVCNDGFFSFSDFCHSLIAVLSFLILGSCSLASGQTTVSGAAGTAEAKPSGQSKKMTFQTIG